MSKLIAMPGGWPDWITEIADSNSLQGSETIIHKANHLARSAGISLESATAMLAWLGSVAMLNHVEVDWPAGIWQPSALTIVSMEEDGAPSDIVTNGLINVARRLGLDPIQDTTKEGPAGLIAELEAEGHGWLKAAADLELQASKGLDLSKIRSLADIAAIEANHLPETQVMNRGNVRALAYPSGRALLSFLYDTSFFNALDELMQHGNLHVRGKVESHHLVHLNLALYAAFNHGSLINLTQNHHVQSNASQLLRQMLVMWPTDGGKRRRGKGRVGSVLKSIEVSAAEGLRVLESNSSYINAPDLDDNQCQSYIAEGVGIRYVNTSRYEKMIRLAIGVAFWRICGEGHVNNEVRITTTDTAMADAILHCHDMGARLMEVCMTRGKRGNEIARLLLRLLDGESLSVEAVGYADESNRALSTIDYMESISLLNADGQLEEEYRFITNEVTKAYQQRWSLEPVGRQLSRVVPD